jgi:hypothetical protein
MADKNNPFEEAQKIMSKETVYSDTELSRITAMAQAIDKLMDYQNIMALTDLSDQQIVLFEKARIMGDFWHISEIDDILNGLAIKRLSRNRKSRSEVSEVLIGLKKTLKSKLDSITGKKQEANNE